MNFHEALFEISGENLYISVPDIMDFTSLKKTAKIVVYSAKSIIEIPFSDNDQKFKELLGFLSFIFSSESILITWNFKNLLSYVKGRTGVELEIQNKIYDLNILESYVGERLTAPNSFREAFQRLSNLGKKNNWKDIHSIYQQIYLPLMFTLPVIETTGIAHKAKHSRLYPFYEIDGQVNGRLKCANVFQKSFNPHNINEEDRENIRPLGFEHKFVYFDFNHMEVSMFQWLTKDEYLGELLLTGQDVYSAIWEALTKQACNPTFRKKCKEIFLPIVYGLGAEGLSKKLNGSVDVAKNVIFKLQKVMPQVFNWIKQQQDSLTDGIASDCYGRVRKFDTAYLVRNFVIQSPASLVCLDKLNKIKIQLKKEPVADLTMHIHDGYVFTAKNSNIQKTYCLVKNILESKDQLYPGLRLRATCKIGNKLSELEDYEPD